ncbi:class I SAM-dependent methyltransferase [Paenibacillus sp. N3.4]|uniref:class I SAM-dependent methyltransferase n=1 Tax=Paenibacillus sp. N3.4 TaxID=2603222 RepID=UPI0011C847EA|nr:phospholipid methyltransferase [Paenibacillus sp. N3.4]TXK86123.1 phospholipid methyltransferase [Paenibacillus sp. N3.4]
MKKPSFFGEFLIHAGQVGSIMPSSRFLTRKMLPVTLPWHKMQQIAELGPGTGVFTKYIQNNMTSQSQMFLFEQNGKFREDLKQRFPEFRILDDACKLSEVVKETGRPFDLIVSGLPFANFSDELQERLFQIINEALACHGVFIAFQYTLLLKKKFQTNFSIADVGYTCMNVPPAWVLKCKKMRM